MIHWHSRIISLLAISLVISNEAMNRITPALYVALTTNWLTLEYKSLIQNHIIHWKVRLLSEFASSKIQIVGISKTFHKTKLWLPTKISLGFLYGCKEMLHMKSCISPIIIRLTLIPRLQIRKPRNIGYLDLMIMCWIWI